MTCNLEASLEKSARASPFVRNALTAEYPRLRRQLRGLVRRLQHSTAGKSAEDILEERADVELLLGALAPFLATYLARSLSRLNEPVSPFASSAGVLLLLMRLVDYEVQMGC